MSTLIMGMLISSSSFAAITKEVNEALTKKLESLKVNVKSINESPIKGLYEVVSQGALYYISEDGQYLINGDMYDLNNGMKNLTGAKVDELRRESTAESFAKIKDFEKDMIVYKADKEKHVITVFTDTSCAYCQKLHSEMADYNKLGITIRYLAFPRGGEQSNAYRTMVSVWCSDNPKEAMDNAKKRRQIDSETCDNTVLEQFNLGVALGITGTPSLFLEDGTMMPGYLPADRLLQLLEEKK
jgi:thiol:disulfide interchange protein DsbC